MHELAGAFLFGMPFLYTMEVWWRGNTAGPARMLAALLVTYIALVALEHAAESKAGRAVSWPRALLEGAQALAVGLFAAALGLLLIGVLEFDAGLHAVAGRVVMEGVPFSLGVGLADFLLGEKKTNGGAEDNRQETKPAGDDAGRRLFVRAGATAMGATVVALTLAPTQEIPLIASGLGYPRLLVLVGASLALSYLIVFASNFVATEAREEHRGGLGNPLAETALAYVISVAMAAGMLWVYQLLGVGDPADRWVSYALVLALPASVGGAAGRLAA